MSQTLHKGWLRRFLGVAAQEAVTEVTEPEQTQDLQALKQANDEQGAIILQLKHQLRMATSSQASHGQAHPETGG